MVIPRRIIPRFAEMTSDEATDMILSAQRIGKVIEKEFDATSLTMAMQDGPQAGQTVCTTRCLLCVVKKLSFIQMIKTSR
jgi:bis(5'-adenosyl)-triphosphatase